MDYIQQAIDKARQERQGRIGRDVLERPETPAAADIASIAPRISTGTGIPTRISYTQTRQCAVPASELDDRRLFAAMPNDKRAEPYRQLRTQALKKLRANGWQTVAVTSPNPDAGKTLTAVNLAISLSQEVNQTVLLVDLDLRNPSVADTLGIAPGPGLMGHLQDGVPIAETLVNPGFERLVVLPGTSGRAFRSEILSSPEMKTLLDDLTSRYESRIIIFDLPALLSDDDALVFAPYVDTTLFVVEDGVSSRSDVERALALLEGNNLLGTVLNKVR